MPSDGHSQVAAQIRELAAKGRYHGRAVELVKLFGVPFTVDGVRVAADALASLGLETKPAISVDEPNRDVTVVIAAALPDTPAGSGIDASASAKAAPGWYPDPAAPATRRYWDGEAWTDEWSAPETSIPIPGPVARPKRSGRVWPAAVLLVLGAVGLWFAETYKPSVANDLGLNGNKFVLKPESFHIIVIVSIVLLVIGGVRLLTAAGRR